MIAKEEKAYYEKRKYLQNNITKVIALDRDLVDNIHVSTLEQGVIRVVYSTKYDLTTPNNPLLTHYIAENSLTFDIGHIGNDVIPVSIFLTTLMQKEGQTTKIYDGEVEIAYLNLTTLHHINYLQPVSYQYGVPIDKAGNLSYIEKLLAIVKTQFSCRRTELLNIQNGYNTQKGKQEPKVNMDNFKLLATGLNNLEIQKLRSGTVFKELGYSKKTKQIQLLAEKDQKQIRTSISISNEPTKGVIETVAMTDSGVVTKNTPILVYPKDFKKEFSLLLQAVDRLDSM